MITYCINNKYIKLDNMCILILFNILNVKGFKICQKFLLTSETMKIIKNIP